MLSNKLQAIQDLYAKSDSSSVQGAIDLTTTRNLMENHIQALKDSHEGRGSNEQVERTLAELKQSVMKSFPEGSEIVKGLEDDLLGSPVLSESLNGLLNDTASKIQNTVAIQAKGVIGTIVTVTSGVTTKDSSGAVGSPDVLPDLRPVFSILPSQTYVASAAPIVSTPTKPKPASKDASTGQTDATPTSQPTTVTSSVVRKDVCVCVCVCVCVRVCMCVKKST